MNGRGLVAPRIHSPRQGHLQIRTADTIAADAIGTGGAAASPQASITTLHQGTGVNMDFGAGVRLNARSTVTTIATNSPCTTRTAVATIAAMKFRAGKQGKDVIRGGNVQPGTAIATVAAITMKIVRLPAGPAMPPRGGKREVVIARTWRHSDPAVTAITAVLKRRRTAAHNHRKDTEVDPCGGKRRSGYIRQFHRQKVRAALQIQRKVTPSAIESDACHPIGLQHRINLIPQFGNSDTGVNSNNRSNTVDSHTELITIMDTGQGCQIRCPIQPGR